MLKGEKRLNKTISTQLEGFGISEAFLANEYSYYFENESVSFKIYTNNVEDIWFDEFIKERFGYEVRYPFVISLLHEVGHHKANDNIMGDINKFCMREKSRIFKAMENADADEAKKLEWQYFNLPDEIMATQWAVNWAKRNPAKVKQMWEKMQGALLKFYKENGIFDDEFFEE